VRALLDARDDHRAARPASASAEAEVAERAVLAAVPEGVRGFASELVRLARAYTALDDLEHYHTTRLALPLRRGVRALGERLAAVGVVADPMDLFFAHRAPLAAAVAADSRDAWRELGDAIAREKAAYLADRDRTPAWELGAPSAPVESERGGARAAGGDGASLRGIPGSPGVAVGEVFVVRSADDFARFPKGAVLVARTTNPAWTPLFYRAGAVVTESGGPLSHGAVTAREMRIPAVMAVRGVLGALADGTRVRVDGGTGLVEVL
jgi:pyruvate,water dikinase